MRGRIVVRPRPADSLGRCCFEVCFQDPDGQDLCYFGPFSLGADDTVSLGPVSIDVELDGVTWAEPDAPLTVGAPAAQGGDGADQGGRIFTEVRRTDPGFRAAWLGYAETGRVDAPDGAQYRRAMSEFVAGIYPAKTAHDWIFFFIQRERRIFKRSK